MERAWLHGIDLFTNTVGLFIHHDQPTLKRLWHLWLGYFIQEAEAGLFQMLMEEEICSQKGKSWKQIEKELKPIEKNWVKIFTRERFEKYVSDAIERALKPEVRAKFAKKKLTKKGTRNLAKACQFDGSKFE